MLKRSMVLAFFISAFAPMAHAQNLPYLDSDFGCLTREQADRYVRDFSVDTQSFGGLELCDGSRETKKLLNDLTLIEKTEFAAPVDHPFIKGFVDRANYYGWMKSQTRGVERGNDVPYATAYNSGGYFTMQDGWAVLSTLGRVGTIIHEARHTAGYRHYSCASGPYAGTGVSGCDTHYNQGGSHGVEMEYYARVVLEAKNLHPVYQSMARLMLLGRSNFVFNEQPMRKREALVAYAPGKVTIVDGTNLVERAAPAVAEGSRLKCTSFGASLVNGTEAVALDLYGNEAGTTSLADDYSYFKLFHAPRENAPTAPVATEEFDQGVKRYFTVLNGNGSLYSYNFGEGAWYAPVAAAGAKDLVTITPDGRAGLFVVKADGAMVPFDATARRLGQPLGIQWPADTAAFARMGGRLVSLKSDGRLVDAEGAEALPGHFTDLVNVPLYDAFEVVP